MEGVMRSEAHPHSVARDPAQRAYQLLHWGLVLVPMVAGVDKFFQWLTDWDQYLAPAVERALPFSAQTFMRITGVAELCAAVIVAVWPRIGGYVVAAWLTGIVVDLLLARGWYDIVLRDVGLIVAALALSWLAKAYDRKEVRR